MVRKAYWHSVFRLFKDQFARFLALTLISAIGIGFIAGLGPIQNKLESSYSRFVEEKNVPDLTLIKGKGFLDTDIQKIEDSEETDGILPYFFMEGTKEESIYRYIEMDFSSSIDKLTLEAGVYPSKEDECLALAKSDVIAKHEVGDKTTIVYSYMGLELKNEFTVVGIVKDPLFSSLQGAKSYLDPSKDLNEVVYVSSSYSLFHISNSIMVRLKGVSRSNVYSSSYKKEVKEKQDNLLSSLSDPSISSIPLVRLPDNGDACNEGVYSLGEYAKKVSNIAIALSVFFIAIVALVIANTLSRLVAEERGNVACYLSLGVREGDIAFKYLLFALLSIILGASLGYFVVGTALVNTIYNAFSLAFTMPAAVSFNDPVFGIVASIICLAISLLSTYLVIMKSLHERPSELLLPKAPKKGKLILLERIPFIWKHLSFKHKNTARNLFRYPLRLIMTVVTVAVCLSLLLASFGLLDSSFHYSNDSTSMLSSISLILLVSAIVLSVVVLYNLTNISVSERKREIATLMVLGYRDKEVGAYIYREINIMVFFGIIAGIPLGYFFCDIIFKYVDFGSVTYMKWYSWIIAPLIELGTSFVSDILLFPKIKKTDMNGCLKAVE